MLYIIGIFIAFFLAVLILTKKCRNRADVFLGCWLIVIGFHIWGYFSFVSGIVYTYPFLMWLNLPYAFVHGPMLYLYTVSLTNPERFKSKKWLLHFALPILASFSTLPFLFLSEHERILIYKTNGKGYENYLPDWTTLLIISGVFYVVITYGLLQKHKRQILNQFSNQEKINLKWLRFLLYGMVITWVIIILGGSDKWIFSTSTAFLVFIGFFGLKQVGIFTDQNVEIKPEDEPVNEKPKLIAPDLKKNKYASSSWNQKSTIDLQLKLPQLMDNESLFTDQNIEIKPEDEPVNEKPKLIAPDLEKKKYARSSLNQKTAIGLQLKLQQLMEKERLFTEPELTLTDLATRLEIHPNYLSQVINDLEGVNFYDYINTLRIQEFKRLVSLPENQKYTFLSLAYECGFNSKSAFNRFFKKSTNLTPSEYLKSLN